MAGFGAEVAAMAAEYVKAQHLADIYAGQVALASSEHPASTAAARFIFEALGLLQSGARIGLGVSVSAPGSSLDDMAPADVSRLLVLAQLELGTDA